MTTHKVKRMQDEDSHWYWIPEDKAEEFEEDLEALPELDTADDSTYEAYGKFEMKYSGYMTGGSPDLTPDAFSQSSYVIEVLVDQRRY